MAEKGSFTFIIDSRLRDRQKPKKRRRVCHYDSGMAIDLRYNGGYYAPQSMSLPGTAALSGGYRVEAFEDDDQDSPWGTGELDDSSALQYSLAPGGGGGSSGAGALFRASSLSDEVEDTSVWGAGQLEQLDAAPQSASLSDDVEDAPVWGAGQLDELDAAPRSASLSDDVEQAPAWGTGELDAVNAPDAGAPLPSASSFAGPTAAAFSRRLQEQGLLESHDEDTRAFAQDLQAILAGKKDHPSTTGRTSPAPVEEQSQDEEEQPPPSGTQNAYASSFSHDVFDRMSPGLSMAKTFDLGSYDLSRQFDAFDRELDRAEQRQRPVVREQSVADPRREFAEDLAWITGKATRALEALDLRFDVPLVPQQTNLSCWAAGCAMLVGWRDQMSIDPSEIARAAGAWAQYAHGLAPQDVSVFPIWGMTPEQPQSYTVQGFYDLLNRYGPLWVASAEPGPHIRVVTGMSGDGTPDGTTLSINDPWENGMTTFHLPNAGAQCTETYTQFVRKQETLARSEIKIPGAIYVAHLSGPRTR